MKTRVLGGLGENLAAQYLKSKGFEIVHNNFTVRGGEIDLVARLGSLIVFVEVKTRTKMGFGFGEESVDRYKKMRLKRAIERYLDRYVGGVDADYRVDLLDVELEPETKALRAVRHFEDIEM